MSESTQAPNTKAGKSFCDFELAERDKERKLRLRDTHPHQRDSGSCVGKLAARSCRPPRSPSSMTLGSSYRDIQLRNQLQYNNSERANSVGGGVKKGRVESRPERSGRKAASEREHIQLGRAATCPKSAKATSSFVSMKEQKLHNSNSLSTRN